MINKLRCILLIDDTDATNFINKILINKANCSEKIIALESGKNAIDYLTSLNDKKQLLPELIFLDLNMPAMNGWEFLNEYRKKIRKEESKVKIVILTTSQNPEDKEKSKTYKEINGFEEKPLTLEVINKIIDTHFKS